LIERECRSGPLWEIDGLPLDSSIDLNYQAIKFCDVASQETLNLNI